MKQAFLPIVVILVAGPAGWQLSSAPGVLTKPVVQKLAQQAVETDVHEFMEHYNQPIYRRPKEAFASDSDNKDGKKWSKIADDSLLLAEVGNLFRGDSKTDDTHATTTATEQ